MLRTHENARAKKVGLGLKLNPPRSKSEHERTVEEKTLLVMACVFMRRQLFSILSRPMNMEFRVMYIAWPSK